MKENKDEENRLKIEKGPFHLSNAINKISVVESERIS